MNYFLDVFTFWVLCLNDNYLRTFFRVILNLVIHNLIFFFIYLNFKFQKMKKLNN